jgi:hypothetical protein
MIDLTTPEGIREWARSAMQSARENFAAHGSLQPLVLLLVTADPETGRPLPRPGLAIVAPKSFATPRDKEAWAAQARQLAAAGKAIAALTLMEMWLLVGRTTADLGQSIAANPRRVERLMATLERPDTTEVWLAEIERSDNDRATAGDFERLPVEVGGRFTGLLAEVWS